MLIIPEFNLQSIYRIIRYIFLSKLYFFFNRNFRESDVKRIARDKRG